MRGRDGFLCYAARANQMHEGSGGEGYLAGTEEDACNAKLIL